MVGHGLPMGDGGQEPVAPGEFTSEDLSPVPSVKGFLVLWGVGSHYLEAVQTQRKDNTAMRQERVLVGSHQAECCTALDKEGVFLSSHKAHGDMSELPRPQQMHQYHNTEYSLYFSYFVQGMKDEEYLNMSTYILQGSQSLICEQRSH